MRRKTLVYQAVFILLVMQPLFGIAKGNDVNVKNNNAPAPLSFIENKGQVTDQHNKQRTDIDYKLNAGGMSIFVGNGQIHYQWNKDITEKRNTAPDESTDRKEQREAFSRWLEQGTQVETYRMDMLLVGANPKAMPATTDRQPYYESYYLPQYKGEVHAYNKITYRDIYPKIDWVLYTEDNHLKYDFVVHPGGNPADIKLRYDGATALNLKGGALTAITPMGSVTEQKPYSYDAVTKKEITSAFILSENTLTFNLAKNTTGNDIVIDPALQWATYFGDASADHGLDVASSSAGDAYMAGYTNSSANIATTSAHQVFLSGNYDALIVKFNNTGVRQWCTYFGGSNQDFLASIAVDPSGNVYMGGESYSTGLATAGTHQTSINGPYDALLVKFTSTGTLLWCTYFGGNSWEYSDVAIDGSGNVYICGETNSTGGLATTGAYQPAAAGAFEAYLARFTTSGTLLWATYFGGINYDWASTVAFDPSGNVYMNGATSSTSGITTAGAHQVVNGGLYDGFLSKWTSSGTLLWATYYGGSSGDNMSGLACDPSGNVYASGSAYSDNDIATIGAHQPARGSTGAYDAFLVKFNSAGVRQWGTYYGGTGQDYSGSLVIGINGYLYVNGYTYSTNGIATTNGYQTALAGSADMYLAEFSTAGVRNWASYYGGPALEYSWGNSGGSGANNGGSGMCASPTGKLYTCGTTNSATSIATAGAHQTILGNATATYDAFLTSWIIDTTVYINRPYIDTVFCTGQTFDLHYSVTYPFRAGNTFTAQLSNAAGSFATPVNIGLLTATGNGIISVTIPGNTIPGSGYRIRIVASNPARTSLDNGVNIRVKPYPQLNATSNSPICEQATLNLTATSTTPGTITYSWSGPASFSAANNQNPARASMALNMAGDYIVAATLEGCTTLDTATAVVKIIPAVPAAGSNSPVCPNTPMNLTASSATSGVTYGWTGPGTFTSVLQNPQVSANTTTAMAGTYSVTATLAGCTSAPGTALVIVAITTPTPTAGASSPLCAGTNLLLTAPTIAGATYSWTGPNGFASSTQNPTIPTVQPIQAGIYTVIATLNGCISLPSGINVVVNVVSTVGAYASPNDTICKGFTATFVAFPQNPGTIPLYQWYKNFVPIANATGLIYAANDLVTGDKIYCRMIATDVCKVPVVATTDTFDMVVLPIVTVPQVNITANPGFAVSPQQEVTLTANVLNGGLTPKYQWYKNGKMMVGARYATWVTNGLYFGDRISVDIISEDPCAEQKTAGDTIIIGHPTGIDQNNREQLSLYPNPNKGSFTITGIYGADVKLEIVNAIGQVVFTHKAKEVNGEVVLDTRLPQGVYLIRLNSNNQTQALKFTITE